MSEYICKEDISRVLLDRISANESCLSNARERRYDEGEQHFNKLVFEDEQIASLIEELPSADVRPNIHAHWESIGEGFQCSRCGTSCAVTETADKWIWHTDDKFCRGCGADMRGKA